MLLVVAVAAILVGCKKEKDSNSVNSPMDEQQCVACESSFNDVTKEQKNEVFRYLSSIGIKDDSYDFIGSLPIDDNGIEYDAICMKNRNSEANFLTITMDEEYEVMYYLPSVISKRENLYTIEVQNNGDEYFGASFFVDFSKHSISPSNSPICYGPTLGEDIAECVAIAMSACINDPECAFLCGYTFEYCIGATILACTIHHLKGGAHSSNNNNSSN